MILSGSGAPDVKLGAEGDFYIDLKNSNLYGPKTETLWGSGSSMKGSAGDKGDKGDKSTAGSQFLSGANNTTTIGAVGDFYFNTSSGMLFGSKTSSGWGNGISL